MVADLPALGFGLPVAGPWATPEAVAHVARRAEDLGYAHLWAFQRVLHPVGSELDPAHRAVLDPVVTLAFAAACTRRIGLGTATVCAPFVPPALLAKATASLDVLSGGRLTVGLGMGWLREEYEAVGVPFASRGARLEEYIRCLIAVWTEEPVAFAGERYSVPPSSVQPKPRQRPHPPVLLGGTARAALERAGRLAQGWIASSLHTFDQVGPSVEIVRAAAQAAGRDPDALRIVARVVVEPADDDPGPSRRFLHGTWEQILDDLGRLRAQGITEAFVDCNLSPRVGYPDADPEAAVSYADAVLEHLAPGPARP